MKNTFKKLVLCFLVLSAGIMSTAAVKRISPERENPSEPADAQYASAKQEIYYLRDWQGYIAVFEGSSETPMTLTDIQTQTLNNVDRGKLQSGIPARDETELASLLEDLSS